MEKRLDGLFTRMRDNNIKISVKKFVISTDIEFRGFHIKGPEEDIQIFPDPEKIKAVQDMVTHRDKRVSVCSLVFPTK